MPDKDTDGAMEAHASCAEDNPWTPIVPRNPADDDDLMERLRALDPQHPSQGRFWLHLKQFARDAPPSPNSLAFSEYQRYRDNGRMSFHTFGCSGDPEIQTPQAALADALVADLKRPDPPAFLFHLGDIVYKEKHHEESEDGDGALTGGELLRMFYSNEFYAAYRGYQRPIFAIPGNHDGKYKRSEGGAIVRKKSPMWHFLRSFCTATPIAYPQNEDGAGDPTRPSMTQPYPYFVLETPVAFLVGLYSNVCNGGALDLAGPGDPSAVQYRWLVARLKDLRQERHDKGRALIVATHYPPFSGAADFVVRGDPFSPSTPEPRPAAALASVLLSAFREADVWPDLLLSAHAHHYQRLTYTAAAREENGQHLGGRQIPCVIVGGGGHAPINSLWRDCADNPVAEQPLPFAPPLPPGCVLPSADDTVLLEAYNDQDFGYLHVTVDTRQRQLTGAFVPAYSPERELQPGRTRTDIFHVHLDDHTVT